MFEYLLNIGTDYYPTFFRLSRSIPSAITANYYPPHDMYDLEKSSVYNI